QPAPLLAAYVNVDLRNLEVGPKAELAKLLTAQLPDEYLADGPFDVRPWYLWRIKRANGLPGFVLFQGCHLWMIPGQSRAAVHVFDGSGQGLSSTGFRTGHRIDIDIVRPRHERALQGPAIEVTSGPHIGGCDVARQVYGVIDDRVALLWLED